MPSSVIMPIYKSLIKHLLDVIAELNTAGTFGVIEYHDWESRGEEKDLPNHTLVGLDGFSFRENKGLWQIRVALAVSSFRDQNLLREIELIDEIHKRFGQDNKVPLLNMSTGDEV